MQKKKSRAWYEGVCVCRRGELQFAHIAIRLCCKFTHISNRPHSKFTHVGGLIAISPYTCVFWTFANIHVNTCKYTCKYTKTSRAWYEYVYVCRRGDLQIAHTEGFVSKL